MLEALAIFLAGIGLLYIAYQQRARINDILVLGGIGLVLALVGIQAMTKAA